MRRALVIGAALLLGAAALLTACGGPGEEPEPLSASELVARAYEAMSRQSFALVPQGGSIHGVEYAASDLMLITTDGYDDPVYIFLAASEIYVSETGRRWLLWPESGYWQWRLTSDPRELLRIAADVRDEGTQDFGGKPHRVVAARPDATKFADEYLAEAVELVLEVKILDYPCPDCTLTFDRQRLEELGYRIRGGGHELFKGEDIRINAYPEWMMFWVRGVGELSPALENEFRSVLEAYSVDPDLLDTAEVTVHDDRERAPSHVPDEVRFWIDPQTFVVSKMELDWGTLAFVDYGEVQLPKPEPAMLYEEADALFGEIQVRWRPLAEALEAYARSHGGLYPDELTPAVVQEALESEGLAWPDNAFTGEPMRESPERNPGDLHYQPSLDRLAYCAEVYDWEGEGVPVGPHGAADAPCPTATPSSP